MSSLTRTSALGAGLAVLATTAAAQTAQPTFSIDNHSITNGAAACGGGAGPVSPADVLVPATATGAPRLWAPGPPCKEIPGGLGGGTLNLAFYPNADVDALSYGVDDPIGTTVAGGSLWFSVDEFAAGHPFLIPGPPTVQTESGPGDVSASVFVDTGLPPIPSPWNVGPVRNTEAIDGDGIASGTGFTQPGLGLVEPNPPGMPPDAGDNLDALDVDGAIGSSGFVYFSLDGALWDPCSQSFGTASAVAHGFPPAAVLYSNLGGAAPNVFVGPGLLGLDRAGFATDDLDALALLDQGTVGTYDPPTALFDWTNGTSDMVLFSVRRGSAVIGAPDSIWGIPIEEGDVLVPPMPGGLNGNPGVLVPAEHLGLATRRNGTAYVCGLQMVADELDALDFHEKEVIDCDGDLVEDAYAIASGQVGDVNQNGIPDGCELTSYCTAGTTSSGCNAQITATGAPSLSAGGGFDITVSSAEGGRVGLIFWGYGEAAIPWGAGSTSFLCITNPRIRTGVQATGGTLGACDGTMVLDYNAWIAAHPGAAPPAGATIKAQGWFRDPLSPPKNTALSDALSFLMAP